MVCHLGEPSLELWQWWIDVSSRNWFQSIKYVIIYNASVYMSDSIITMAYNISVLTNNIIHANLLTGCCLAINFYRQITCYRRRWMIIG